MPYAIGLDCGITSVGYAVVDLDHRDEPQKILYLGSRIFDKAENPKDGSSLAKPRREARGARRRLRRHRFRLERIRGLLTQQGILTQTELDALYEGQLSDVYALRAKALDNSLTAPEFARVLIHIAQRRGFKSNRKADAADKEAGELLSAVSKNEKLMQEKGYRTVGEMFFADPAFATCKRNKGENYLNTVSRAMVEREVIAIFEAQRRLGSPFAQPDTQSAYLEILLSQRSFEEGPGGNSPYGGNQIEKMLGNCTFYPEEKRAVKASYSFQLFTLWQSVNHLRILRAGETRPLTDDERRKVFEAAHKTPDLTFAKIRKALNLADDEFFDRLRYTSSTETEATEKKEKFNFLKPFHEIRKCLARSGIDIYALTRDQLNTIGYAFTVYKNEERIREHLVQRAFSADLVEALADLPSFAKAGHISVKACDVIIPHLEQGLTYDKACEAAGIAFRAHTNTNKTSLLPAAAQELENIVNPVVRRAVSQTIKVINAIIRRQQESPVFINIELARELSKTFEERRTAESRMKDNMALNERVKEEIVRNFGKAFPTGLDIVKLKLWKEQDGYCPYSLTKIEYSRLFEDGYADIDHIVPYSICFDDSYKNKVLVKTAENRNKGNRLPMQFLQDDRREKFEVWVKANIRDLKKRQRLLKKTLTAADEDEYKARNLQDTQYLSRFLLNYIRDYLDFAPTATNRKKRVTAVNGSVTAYMRKRWGIQKIREDGDLHHAADAAVVACVTDGLIKRVSDYAKRRELYIEIDDSPQKIDKKTGETKDLFPPPWQTFRKELVIRLSNDPVRDLNASPLPNYADEDIWAATPCFVSRMPTRKVTGAAHKDTVRSPKALEDGMVISKKALTDLRLDEHGEIAGYYNPESDRLLYEALKQQLAAFELFEKGGSTKQAKDRAKAAFAAPFYKPRADGTPGPVVKKVKVAEKASLTVDVHGGQGVAANDSMVRIDVFRVEGEGYYFVPIYVADTVRKQLPNRACVAYKPYEEWKIMEDKNFLFSLYPGDLVRVTAKKPLKMAVVNANSTLPPEHTENGSLLYYSGADIATASIALINHDNTYKARGVGIKTLKSLEKYQVDILGECRKVGRETRQGFGGV